MNPAKSLVRAGLLGLFSILLVPPASAAPASASHMDDPPSLVKHLRTELRAKDPVRQERALMDVIALSNCPASCTVSLASATGKTLRIENDTELGTAFDLDALIPDLQSVYRRGSTDSHRLMALAVLINVGNAKALEQLAEDKEQQGTAVRTATDRSLVGFYLAKYPELTERTMRTKNLSIEQIRRAEAVRVRVERRNSGG